MATTVTVAAAQLGPTTEDKQRAAARMQELIEEAKAAGVNIMCFPELALTPFFPARFIPDFGYLFDQVPGELTDGLLASARAAGIAVVLPYGEHDGLNYFNSAAVYDSGGNRVGTYRKVHIPCYFPGREPEETGNLEKFYFKPGNTGLQTFVVDGVRIGVQICYDRLFPEGSRELALQGAQLCFYPNNMAKYGESYRVEAWSRLLQVRAYENGMFAVAPNKAGREDIPPDVLRTEPSRTRDNVGDSLVIGPLNGGEVLKRAQTDGDELVHAVVDLDEVELARRKLPFWRDRRPECYGQH